MDTDTSDISRKINILLLGCGCFAPLFATSVSQRPNLFVHTHVFGAIEGVGARIVFSIRNQYAQKVPHAKRRAVLKNAIEAARFNAWHCSAYRFPFEATYFEAW